MAYKILILVVGFYFLAIAQMSFFPTLSILGVTPNLVLIGVCLLGFFEKKTTYSGISGVLTGGLLLDIFSHTFIGASVAAYLITYLLLKEILRQLQDVSRNYSFLYFAPIIIISVVFYDFLLSLFYYLGDLRILFSFNIYASLVRILYTLGVGTIAFYIFKTASLKLNESK